MRTNEHIAKHPTAQVGFFALLLNALPCRSGDAPSTRRLGLVLACSALLALAALAPSSASAKQARVFAGTFGAATNPSPFPANPYPLNSASSVAVDKSTGDVYVADKTSHRIEKFDSSGQFVFMFGKAVNRTAVEESRPESEQNICPAAGHAADICQAGEKGSSSGAFENLGQLAIDNSADESQGDLYIADNHLSELEKQRIDVTATGGTFTLTFEGEVTAPIAFDAPLRGPGSLQAALQALPSFVGVEPNGSPDAYLIEFGERFLGVDVPQVTCNGAGLSGAGASCAASTVVQGSPPSARVDKFSPSGHLIETWVEGGHLDGSGLVDGPFAAISGIAVDPSGNLWVSTDTTFVALGVAVPGRDYQFRQDGQLTSSFLGNLPGQPSALGPLAVDSEDFLYFGSGGGLATKFDSTGKYLGHISPSQTELKELGDRTFATHSLAMDSSTGDLFLGGEERLSPGGVGVIRRGVIRRYDSSCHPAVAENVAFEPGCEPVESFGAGLLGHQVEGLAVNPSSHSIDATLESSIGVFAFLTVPDVTTTNPTNPTHASATLNGTINPSGIELNPGTEGCRFEWGETIAYGHIVPCDKTAAQIGSGSAPVEIHAAITGLEVGKTYHYRLVASNHNDVNGSIDEPSVGSDLAFGPPLIESASAIDAAATSATLQAKVNPNDLDTNVRFEYGTEAGVYGQSTEEFNIGSFGVGQVVTPHLQGLIPATTYHYRLVAENVLAEGAEAILGEDLAFTTQGASALALPDGRKWELVSPPNKFGANLFGSGSAGDVQASTTGDAITYVANAATEPNPPANFESIVQVLSTRGSHSWSSQDINTPRPLHANGVSSGHGSEIRLFSSDLSLAGLTPRGALNPELSDRATEQTPFLRTNFQKGNPSSFCTTSCYLPLLTGAEGFANVPEGTQFGADPPTLRGADEAFDSFVFSSFTPLIEGAPQGSVYLWSEGQLRLVSVLPTGTPASFASGPAFGDLAFAENVRNAISRDGSRVIWSEHEGKRHLFLRDMNREETLQLDKVEGGSGAGTVEPRFQTASKDGSTIFFTDQQQLTPDSAASAERPELYRCDVVEGEGGELECDLSDLSAGVSGQSADVVGVPGASDDGSYVYFIANGVLTGTEQNESGEVAEAGSCGEATSKVSSTCNLYLSHDGSTTFIARLSLEDRPDWAETPSHGVQLVGMTARVTPNGQRLAFMSQRSLTGYDTRDVTSGEPAEEVYLYDAAPQPGRPALVCASCNPTGARPHAAPFHGLSAGQGGITFGEAGFGSNQPIAGSIPGWSSAGGVNASGSYQPRYLSDAGRLFFNSQDALVPSDSNGTGDVYEYEPPGVGDCTTESSSFAESSGGCISLITSGTSKDESAFLDASESGDDVFFLTKSQLSKRDIDTARDVYDARVNGGEAEEVKPVICEGDGCQLPATPPNDPTPGSLSFHGSGNVKEEPKAKKRSKKKHKKKTQKKQKRAANAKHGGAK